MNMDIDNLHQNTDATEEHEVVNRIDNWDELTDDEIGALLSDKASQDAYRLLWSYRCARLREKSSS